jgi:uncharacterized membrane protein
MKKALWISLAIGVLQLVAGVIAFQYMPDSLPTNWNVSGEITDWTGRWILFLPGAITVLISPSLYFLPKIDPKGENIRRSGKGYPILMVIIALLMFGMQSIIICAGLGYDVPVDRIIPIALGVMFVILGVNLPQAKQNYFYGIRLPWTLANEEVWTKTHKVGGKVFVIAGLLFIAGAFIPAPWNFAVPMAGMFIGIIYTAVYSYRQYKKLTQTE